MNKPHKHAELIKAWADGAEIEVRADHSDIWEAIESPRWFKCLEYRIKPQPKIVKAYMHYDNIERMVNKGEFNTKEIPQQLFSDTYCMDEHLEFTFADGKLTNVEMKDATN